jgi:hypothetical protein
MFSVQVLDSPLQSPLQPLKASEVAAAAVSVTSVRAGKSALQADDGQLMPAGMEVTVPGPVTVTVTGLAKSAETAVYWDTETVQGLA